MELAISIYSCDEQEKKIKNEINKKNYILKKLFLARKDADKKILKK